MAEVALWYGAVALVTFGFCRVAGLTKQFGTGRTTVWCLIWPVLWLGAARDQWERKQ